ncbi:MAG: hypothetical protein GF398_21535 [Chitinivibrionales bacterium]|nr:hypothetical protein [Chitinivibrionales bacterium]
MSFIYRMRACTALFLLTVGLCAQKFDQLDSGDSIKILGLNGHSIQVRERGGFYKFFDQLFQPLGAFYDMVPRIHNEQTDSIYTDSIIPGYQHYIMVGSTSPRVYFSGSWLREYEGAVDKFNELGVAFAWVFKQYEIRDSARARDTARVRQDIEDRLATYGGRAIPVSMLQALVINRFDNNVKIIIRDAIHGSDICAYTWSLMFYCYLTGESPEGKSAHTPNTPPEFTMTDDDVVWMQRTAWEIWQAWEQNYPTRIQNGKRKKPVHFSVMRGRQNSSSALLVKPDGKILPAGSFPYFSPAGIYFGQAGAFMNVHSMSGGASTR